MFGGKVFFVATKTASRRLEVESRKIKLTENSFELVLFRRYCFTGPHWELGPVLVRHGAFDYTQGLSVGNCQRKEVPNRATVEFSLGERLPVQEEDVRTLAEVW